jgi:ankyrin repeat protein
VNEGGLTALHYAAYHNHTAAAWALLRCFPPQLDPASPLADAFLQFSQSLLYSSEN